MSLRFSTSLARHRPHAEQSLRAILESRRYPQLAALRAPGLQISRPHPVYFLAVSAVTDGTGLAAAQRIAVRFSLLANGHAVGAAEVPLKGEDAAIPHAAIDVGSQDAAAKIEQLAASATDQADAEVRYLRIPALQVYGIWLASGDPTDHVIHVTKPSLAPLVGAVLTERELLRHLLRIAKLRTAPIGRSRARR